MRLAFLLYLFESFAGMMYPLLNNTTTNVSNEVMKYVSDDNLCDYKQNNFIIDLISLS